MLRQLFARVDAACKRSDARWEKWLDRRLSPIFDVFIVWYPLIALAIIGVLFLL